MRKLFVPILLIALTGCVSVRRTHTGPAVPPTVAPCCAVSDVGPNAPKNYTYWYSATQFKALTNIYAGVYGHSFTPLTVTISGKKHAYTECTASAAKGPSGKFRDYKKVGTVSGQSCKPF